MSDDALDILLDATRRMVVRDGQTTRSLTAAQAALTIVQDVTGLPMVGSAEALRAGLEAIVKEAKEAKRLRADFEAERDSRLREQVFAYVGGLDASQSVTEGMVAGAIEDFAAVHRAINDLVRGGEIVRLASGELTSAPRKAP